VAETVGWLADKLSIMELKRYHMREQMERTDAAPAFRDQCRNKLEVLTQQRDDLAAELATLLADIAAGRLALARVEGMEPVREIFLVRASGRTLTRAAQAFLDFARTRLT